MASVGRNVHCCSRISPSHGRMRTRRSCIASRHSLWLIKVRFWADGGINSGQSPQYARSPHQEQELGKVEHNASLNTPAHPVGNVSASNRGRAHTHTRVKHHNVRTQPSHRSSNVCINEKSISKKTNCERTPHPFTVWISHEKSQDN